MALEPSAGRRSTSPISSGRVSPISRKWARQQAGEEPVIKDKIYRRYASGVDRSLSLFDTALQEWADYISFLGRLLKSLQAHPSNIAVIPSKGIVARRLAQCLNPSLPSGVHQKALEVYDFIFSLVGKDSLSRDLPIYLPGLSSTLSFASLSVRSPFLTLLETHFLKLDPTALRPALKAIILALLPGLEEETSEDFERTLKLVNGFKLAVRPQGPETIQSNKGPRDEYFWQCFFLASITSNSRRAGALAYLIRSLPRLGAPLRRNSVGPVETNDDTQVFTDQIATVVTSPEPGLLIRCFAAGLSDDQILIQRGYLDLLVTHLPLHAKVLQNLVKQEDLELLLIAASKVVSRRDMSLNRRLWAWLLGPEPPPSTEPPTSLKPLAKDATETYSWSRTHYFEQYGLKPLTRGILKMIDRDHRIPLERAKPFRICLSLMDRWEIGGLVVPEIFLPVIRNVQRYQKQSATKADFHEVLRSASMFFDGVESGLIWGEIIGLITTALGTKKAVEALENLSLVKFVLTNFNVREEEMLMVHAPIAALTLLAVLENTKDKDEASLLSSLSNSEDISMLAISNAMDLIELIPERAFNSGLPPSQTNSPNDQRRMPDLDQENDRILEKVQKFYIQDQGNLDASPPPLPIRNVCHLLVRKIGRISSQSLAAPMSNVDIATKTRLLVTVLSKSPKTTGLLVKELLDSIHIRLSSLGCLPFSAFTSIVSLVTTLYPNSYISTDEVSTLVDPLIRQAWSYLSASQPKYHVETTRSLWQLQNCLSFSNHEIEGAISNIIMDHEVSGTFSSRDASPGRIFAILWTHSLQDSAAHLDRRESRSSNGESKVIAKTSGARAYEVMLGRPLFLLLDALLDEKTQLFVTVRIWLQNPVGIEKFFQLFVSKLADFRFLQRSGGDQSQSETLSPQKYSDDDDFDQCHYYLQKLLNVLKWSPDSTWAALAKNNVAIDNTQRPVYLITGEESVVSFQLFFVHVCLRAISGSYHNGVIQLNSAISQLHRTALSLLHQILLGPYSSTLSPLRLQDKLISRLQISLDEPDPFIQVSLLDVIFAALKLSLSVPAPRPQSPFQDRKPSTQDNAQLLKPDLAVDPSEREVQSATPPASLVNCFQAGFAAPNSRLVLDSWINFLSECLPFYTEAIFQIIIPLVETFCTQIEHIFHDLQTTFKDNVRLSENDIAPETTLISLLNGLEQVLARGHEKLIQDEARSPVVKSPDQPQGFFGNMVSGVFSSDVPQARTLTANNRLTVLLSFQDAVRMCFKIWSWGGRGLEGSSQDVESVASFTYTSLRMRNRARRLLEHLFAAEPLECLETVIEIWQKASKTGEGKHTAVFSLLHVLDGSRPKHTIPAIFDAMYSRTNPNALEPARKSTLTSTLLDIDLAIFLVEYARSLEDDAMDEIWTDCMTFLRDILANPFPHRQTLPSLLGFVAILGEKVDNTTFGEQKKLRRELGDLFLRLLTATFTTKPIAFSESTSYAVSNKLSQPDERPFTRLIDRAEDVVGILASITPILPAILVESDRVLSAVNIISTSVIGPILRSKAFPENVTKSVLTLLHQITRLTNTQKIWKKDLGDSFNDARFFSSTLALLESDWLPLLKQWVVSDKERMPELLSRISPPTTAGIVFGVGATSARLEADRKTQLNLRRIATLILAATDDAFIVDITALEEKLVELLSATTTSSPSSTTRGEIYMVIRALILKTSAVHLAFLWPTITADLYAAISSVVAPDHSQSSDTYNNFSILQACKLLDLVLCISPDDFQLHEWLFITDTIDAVYRPSEHRPVGLIDGLSEELGSTAITSPAYIEHINSVISTADDTSRRPLLGPGGIDCKDVNLERKDELVGKVLRPFFSQLSIFAFERTYEMGAPDWDACRRDLLKDLFNERGVVKAL